MTRTWTGWSAGRSTRWGVAGDATATDADADADGAEQAEEYDFGDEPVDLSDPEVAEEWKLMEEDRCVSNKTLQIVK